MVPGCAGCTRKFLKSFMNNSGSDANRCRTFAQYDLIDARNLLS